MTSDIEMHFAAFRNLPNYFLDPFSSHPVFHL